MFLLEIHPPYSSCIKRICREIPERVNENSLLPQNINYCQDQHNNQTEQKRMVKLSQSQRCMNISTNKILKK